MKYVQQFSIILLISVIGEILKTFLPLPVPASVYGLVIMLVALLTGILKLDQVKGAASRPRWRPRRSGPPRRRCCRWSRRWRYSRPR